MMKNHLSLVCGHSHRQIYDKLSTSLSPFNHPLHLLLRYRLSKVLSLSSYLSASLPTSLRFAGQDTAMSNIDLERGGWPRNGKVRGGSAGGANEVAAGEPSPFYYQSDSVEEREWTPWIVPMFVAANVAFFVVAMYVNNCPAHSNLYGSCVAGFLHRLSFQPLHENPLLGPSSSTLEKLGALVWDKIVHQHQGWRLFTCIWLHAGIIHLLANMLSLIFIGIRLEQQFGFVRIGVIYILSGFGGSILSTVFIRNNISVGASGALFGLLGAMLSELITNWSIYTNKAAALFTLLIMIVINLAIGILPHVDNFAHIGGFLSGFLLGFVMLLRPQFGWIERHNLPAASQVKSKHKVYQYVLSVIALLLLIAGFSVGLVMLFRGVNANDHCKWCHYVDCVPTSKWSCGN